MNFVISGWVKESCDSFNNTLVSMGVNHFNKFLNVPEYSGIPQLFPYFSLTNSKRHDLKIPLMSYGTLRNSQGGTTSSFASNCPSSRMMLESTFKGVIDFMSRGK